MKTSKSALNPTLRFSDRVEFYIAYRPKYPPAIIDYLTRECGLTQNAAIADVGSGTGFLAELFLRNKNTVFGVEPNKEMRIAADRLLAEETEFVNVDGTAEASTLQANSVDFVVAGQAFHWFDVAKTRSEFQRILKADGYVALIWNDRRIDTTAFLQDYEHFLHSCGIDYGKVDHKQVDNAVFRQFFGHDDFKLTVFDNYQHFDLVGLKGRLLSSSYIPAEGHPKYPAMIQQAEKLFQQYQVDGTVTLEYDTKVYTGQF